MNDEASDAQDLHDGNDAHERERDEEYFESEFDILLREREEAVAARQRALADFANFQRRATDNEIRARKEGISRVVRMLIPIFDQFDLALAQDTEKMTVEQIMLGVEMVRMELEKAVEECGVKRIIVEPGDAFDPGEHSAMMQVDSDAVAPGHVVHVLQKGYKLGDMVLRPAQVAVATDPADA
ncbi:MAG: nucleotide exchange factor GrpE [Phycisphaerales bacterium]|nr:nucleotide exchange factor GrpE [Phycisphaerales bacterium]